MSKYTPGPWKWKYDKEYGAHKILMGSRLKSSSRFQSHHEIEHNHCIYPEDGPQFQEAQANIRLMCAAPDMYEALTALVGLHEKIFDGQIEDYDAASIVADLWENAKAALHKAGGGS